MSHITLIMGGARSGKSSFAEHLALRLPQPVLYLATATVQDAEMEKRVEKHKARRPGSWQTLELEGELSSALKDIQDCGSILLDCFSLYLSRYLWENHEKLSCEAMEEALLTQAEEFTSLLARQNLPLIVVSSEVGQGLVPENPIARHYRDLLGTLNQYWGKKAEFVYFVSAGIPLKLK